MNCKSQLSVALAIGLIGASAHADPSSASSSLYQRLFKPNVSEQIRTDALAFALATAWQARGCQAPQEVAEVMAAGLARETNAASFQRKLDLVAQVGCGGSADADAASTESETPPTAIDLLVARVTDGVEAPAPSAQTATPDAAESATTPEATPGTSAAPDTPENAPDSPPPPLAYATFVAARGQLAPLKSAEPSPSAEPAAEAPKKDPLKEKKDKLEADVHALEQAREEVRRLLKEHEALSDPAKGIPTNSMILSLCDTPDTSDTKDTKDTKKRPLHLARCSNLVYQEIARRYQIIVESAKTAASLAEEVKDQRVGLLKTLALDLQPRVEYAAALEASTRSANYGLYLGPSQVLQDDGKWKEGSEYLLRFNTEIFDSESKGDTLCVLKSSWCRGYTDISYTSPGVLPKEVEDPSAAPNVFEQEGTLRVRAGIISHSNPWFGMEYGVGLSSPIEDGNNFSRVEPMARVGAHFQTLYNDGVVGELSVGVAHDRSRSFLTDKGTADDPVFEDQFNRVYLEGTVLFPRAEILGGWRLAGRLSMDAPLNGNSEAEVRASVLVYYPLSNWLDTFKPVKAKPAE